LLMIIISVLFQSIVNDYHISFISVDC